MRLSRILAGLLATGLVGACSGSSVTTSVPGPAPTIAAEGTEFESTLYPYSMVLPDGWTVDDASQLPGSDEDLFVSTDGAHWITVGSGIPEPGQTLEDRVELGRDSYPDCASDPADDEEIVMGGERGLLWSYHCEPSFHLAAQTIHNGVGYRLTVHNEEGDTSATSEVMTALLAGFAFTERLAATDPRAHECGARQRMRPRPTGASG